MKKLKVGFIFSRIRAEEKLLLEEFKKRDDVEIVRINDNDELFDLQKNHIDCDVVYERSVSYTRGLYITRMFERFGIPVVNSSDVAARCGDKMVTSTLLAKHNVPTPNVKLAFTVDSALQAVEEMGYPCVIKPVVGSWARLISKINDKHAAEAVLEHKKVLGGFMHQVFYVQEYVDKPGRDIRAFYVGGKTICAIYRSSEHWITNTARGGQATNCQLTPEIKKICEDAAQAIGGGILAMDLFETDEGLTVCEVNHTMEFRNSINTTGANIPEKVVDYVVSVGRNI